MSDFLQAMISSAGMLLSSTQIENRDMLVNFTLKNLKCTGKAIPFGVRIYVIYFSSEILSLRILRNSCSVW